MIRLRKLLLVVFMSSALVACTTMNSVGQTSALGRFSDPDHADLRAGDEVVVTTHDGSTLGLKVASLDDKGLTGQVVDGASPSSVAWADVASVERKETSATRTTLLVVGAVVVTVLVQLAYAAATLLGKVNSAP